MNNWMHDKNWRKKVKNQNVYLMRDHNYAFAAWEIERLHGKKKNATLVHVDSHLDDLPDAVNYPDLLETIQTKEQAIKMATQFDQLNTPPNQTYMNIDNFIWPAIVRNTIGDIYYISDDSQQLISKEVLSGISEKHFNHNVHDVERSRYLLKHLEETCKSFYRYNSIECFKEFEMNFIQNKNNYNVIMDIDLDYFNDSSIYNAYPKIRKESDIINDLIYLKELTDWDVITVALSPEFCGGEKACEYLLSLFLSVFKINDVDLIPW